MENNKFGKILKELRISKNLTQSELGKQLNCSYAAIAKWEAGTRDPSIDNLINLAKLFNVTIDSLVGMDDI